MSDAESDDRTSAVDDGGAFEDDADVDDGGADDEWFMRLEVKEELDGSSGSDGDGAHASAVKRRLRIESKPTMVTGRWESYAIERVERSTAQR
jgi:hypothetical protein